MWAFYSAALGAGTTQPPNSQKGKEQFAPIVYAILRRLSSPILQKAVKSSETRIIIDNNPIFAYIGNDV